jgi:hypothetical protein
MFIHCLAAVGTGSSGLYEFSGHGIGKVGDENVGECSWNALAPPPAGNFPTAWPFDLKFIPDSPGFMHRLWTSHFPPLLSRRESGSNGPELPCLVHTETGL